MAVTHDLSSGSARARNRARNRARIGPSHRGYGHAAGSQPFGEFAPLFQHEVTAAGIPPADAPSVVNAEHSGVGPSSSDIDASHGHMQWWFHGYTARICRNSPASVGSLLW